MKEKFALFFMRMLYYFVFILLAVALIFPHTTFLYGTNFNFSFLERVNSKKIYMVSGEKYQIRCFDLHCLATYKTYNFRIAEVMPWGTIIARKPGNAAVRVKCNGHVYKYRICVFKLNKNRLYIKKGGIRKLTIKNRCGLVRWGSINKGVATVNRIGMVRGKKAGTTVIFARVKGKILKCKVTVR